MVSLKFIHTADLHLDSPFVGIQNLSRQHEQVFDAVRDATFKAFDEIIRLCIEHEVDFLLVAGDAYDAADRSLRAQTRFRDGLNRLDHAGITSFIVHGNHDPLDGWTSSLAMSEKVNVFGSRPKSIPFIKGGKEAARIHGISYPTKTIAPDFGRGLKRYADAPFQIGLFHCNAGGHPGHEPCAPRTIEELVAADLDYWALGHIHERQILSPELPFIGYPGNTQGRHIDESGARGCFLVRVGEDGRLEGEPEFVPTDAVRWLGAEVDITDLETEQDLLPRLGGVLQDLSQGSDNRPVITRLALTGRSSLHASLGRVGFVEDLKNRLRVRCADLSPFVWIEKLEVATRPDRELEARSHARDFMGDLLRLIAESRESPERLQELTVPLKELFEDRRAGRVVRSPEQADMTKLLDEAERLCLNLFLSKDI